MPHLFIQSYCVIGLAGILLWEVAIIGFILHICISIISLPHHFTGSHALNHNPSLNYVECLLTGRFVYGETVADIMIIMLLIVATIVFALKTFHFWFWITCDLGQK